MYIIKTNVSPVDTKTKIKPKKEGKEMKEKLKNRKGITLIALIVTIIVLLILAGISIGAITGNNGIINQAKNAKNDTEYAQWEEQIDIAIVDAESKHREATMDDVIDELINKKVINDKSQVNKKDRTITTNEPAYDITDKLNNYIRLEPGQIAEKNETYKDKNGNTAKIPAGFKVSENENEQTINEGLVIRDESGNEFVWIPVSTESQYQRNRTYRLADVSETAYTDTGYLPDGIQPDDDSSESNEKAEKQAVLNSKGFYVSRYEAGKKSGKLVSQKNVTIWNWILQENCKDTAKTFINNNNVKSALCSGIQWDMVMNFVNGKQDGTGNTFDVTTYDSSRHTGTRVNSGQNEADKVCNIYDLEGNFFEYVAEKNSDPSSYDYVTRGGCYGDSRYAPYRQPGDDESKVSISFRFVLYVM